MGSGETTISLGYEMIQEAGEVAIYGRLTGKASPGLHSSQLKRTSTSAAWPVATPPYVYTKEEEKSGPAHPDGCGHSALVSYPPARAKKKL